MSKTNLNDDKSDQNIIENNKIDVIKNDNDDIIK